MEKGKKFVPTEQQIRQHVSNDLGCAVTTINMIRNDPEMLKAIQDIIIRRIRAEEENEAMQPELDLEHTVNGVE